MPVKLPSIHISANHHFLCTESGEPFFWMGDTAWNLFHRTTREEAERYLVNRQQKGFNVIQVMLLSEQDGLTSPSANGERPFLDNDPACPNEAYFAYVDALIERAAELGIYVCLLPTWADKVTPNWGIGPVIFNPDTAYPYGKWLGSRYADRSNLIWCLGGDRPPARGNTDWMLTWRRMARGLREGLGPEALLTYHSDGGLFGPACIHDEDWSDLVMIQSGHWDVENPAWDWIDHLYRLQPPKPALDGEPCYEDHPIAPWPEWNPANGYFRDYEVRKQIYRSVFAGGCGVTYGHHSIWQFYGPRYEIINHADRTWVEALDRPAATQLIHLKRLMLSRPYFDRIPDQALILSDAGKAGTHIRATRSQHHEQQYAFVYFPTAHQRATLDLGFFRTPTVNASWFDPRTGAVQPIGEFANGRIEFTTPENDRDWVLVLDDPRADFPLPG